MKTIIAGAGDVGIFLAQNYSQKHNVIIVDLDQECLQRAETQCDVMIYSGNITHLPVMKEVQIADADLFIAVTGNDEVNILSASLAQKMGAKYTVARVDSPNFYLEHNRGIVRNSLGIDSMICSSRLIAHELQRKFRKLNLTFIENYAENNLSVFTYEVSKDFHFFGKRPADIDLGNLTKLGSVLRDGVFHKVDSVSSLYEGDHLVIAAESNQVLQTLSELDSSYEPQKLVIIGAGEIGESLAESFSEEKHETLVFEEDEKVSVQLSETLSKIKVIHSSGTDVSALKDQQIEDSAALFSVTKADEVNLMSCLVSKNIGVEHSFSLVHNPKYSQIYKTLGVNETTNAPELIHEAINYLIQNGHINHEHAIGNSNSNVFEVYLNKDLKLSKKHLSDLKLSENISYLGAYVNGHAHFENNIRLINGSYYLFVSSLSRDNFLSYFKGL